MGGAKGEGEAFGTFTPTSILPHKGGGGRLGMSRVSSVSTRKGSFSIWDHFFRVMQASDYGDLEEKKNSLFLFFFLSCCSFSPAARRRVLQWSRCRNMTLFFQIPRAGPVVTVFIQWL
jgi:hypothetical protein